MKAFDMVNRNTLLDHSQEAWLPLKVHHTHPVVSQWHVGRSPLRWEPFEKFNILAPVLFSLFLTQVPLYAFRDLDLGIYIRYCLDSSLFDPWHLTTKTNTGETYYQSVLCWWLCPYGTSRNHLQTIINRFTKASKVFGVMTSLRNIDILLQPSTVSLKSCASPLIVHIWKTLTLLNTWAARYLAMDPSKRNYSSYSESKSSIWEAPHKNLQHRDICLSIKVKVYNTVVLPSLLYSCVMWTLYQKHIKQLEQFHTYSLQSILQIHWQDRNTNQEILNRAGSVGTEAKDDSSSASLVWPGYPHGQI